MNIRRTTGNLSYGPSGLSPKADYHRESLGIARDYRSRPLAVRRSYLDPDFRTGSISAWMDTFPSRVASSFTHGQVSDALSAIPDYLGLGESLRLGWQQYDLQRVLPKGFWKTIIYAPSLEEQKVLPNAILVHSAQHSGRVTEIDRDRIIIEFRVDGEVEQREFSRGDLSTSDEFLRVGAPVLAKTSLHILLPLGKPTVEEIAAAKERFEKEAAEWKEIDPEQVSPPHPVGS